MHSDAKAVEISRVLLERENDEGVKTSVYRGILGAAGQHTEGAGLETDPSPCQPGKPPQTSVGFAP